MWKQGGLGTEKYPLCQSTYTLSRREQFIYSSSFPTSLLLSLSLSLSEEKENRGEARRSLSLRPACLAVFKWCTGTGFCLPRQIHCGSRWANTHTHTHPHLGHRVVCPRLCLYTGWKPSHQLWSQWAQSITMATNIAGQAVTTLGSVWRLFWHPFSAGVDYRVPSLKMFFPNWPMRTVFFFFEK